MLINEVEKKNSELFAKIQQNRRYFDGKILLEIK